MGFAGGASTVPYGDTMSGYSRESFDHPSQRDLHVPMLVRHDHAGTHSPPSTAPTQPSQAASKHSQYDTHSAFEVPVNSARRTYLVTYFALFWGVWLALTGFFVVDRVWLNLWPRESFGKGFGSDRREWREGPWTVFTYDLMARVSGRVCMTALSGCFLTFLPMTFNWLMERQQFVVDFTNAAEDNIRIHRAMGWITALATVPHVWSIMLPYIFSGWSTVLFLPISMTGLKAPIHETKPGPTQQSKMFANFTQHIGSSADTFEAFQGLVGDAVFDDHFAGFANLSFSKQLGLYTAYRSFNESLQNPDGYDILEIDGGCYEVDNLRHSVCINSDDLGRLIGMTLLFAVFMPLSRSRLMVIPYFNAAKILHIFLSVLYFVDIARRRSHPHTWILNAPVFLWYVVDTLCSRYCYRTYKAVSNTVFIDADHMIVYWNNTAGIAPVSMVGDHVFVKSATSWWESGHPFTVIQNRFRHLRSKAKKLAEVDVAALQDVGSKAHKFVAGDEGEIQRMNTAPDGNLEERYGNLSFFDDNDSMRFASNDNDNENNDWDYAIIVQVFGSTSRCLRPVPETRRLASTLSPELIINGPYRSVYNSLMPAAGEHFVSNPLVLLGSGTGGAYLMDFVGYLMENDVRLHRPVYVYYTSKSLPLFQFVTDVLCATPLEKLEVHAALTSHPEVTYTPSHAERDMSVGRLSIHSILTQAPADSLVYYCGSAKLQAEVHSLCKLKSFEFRAGTPFS